MFVLQNICIHLARVIRTWYQNIRQFLPSDAQPRIIKSGICWFFAYKLIESK